MKYFIIVCALFLACCKSPQQNTTDKSIEPNHQNLSRIDSTLDGKWQLVQIDSADFELTFKENRPFMLLNSADMKVTGNAGCNNYFGDIFIVNQDLKRNDIGELKFGNMANTEMACPDLALESQFLSILQITNGYKRVGNQLFLLSNKSIPRLKFEKLD